MSVIQLHHQTHYRFDRPVTLSDHLIRLRPSHRATSILEYQLRLEPENSMIDWLKDNYGNWIARVQFPFPQQALTIDVMLIAELKPVNPFDFIVAPEAEYYSFEKIFSYPADLLNVVLPFLQPLCLGLHSKQWLNEFLSRFSQPLRTVELLVAMNQKLATMIRYVVRREPGVQSPEHTLLTQQGSCRDSCWLMINLLRALGLAARFVSGYLIQLENSNVTATALHSQLTDLHAWAEVYIPGAGWIGLDPTSGLLTTEGHIPLACTPSPLEAAPVYGFTSFCKADFDFNIALKYLNKDKKNHKLSTALSHNLFAMHSY